MLISASLYQIRQASVVLNCMSEPSGISYHRNAPQTHLTLLYMNKYIALITFDWLYFVPEPMRA